MKKKKGLLTFIPYDMSIECDFEKLGQFVTALESDERLITIEEININSEKIILDLHLVADLVCQ